MSDRRRQIGAFTIAALVLLRLSIGWHFYREGSSKLVYDPNAERFSDRFHVAFSAEPFLSEAKGPLADWFQWFAPRTHNWPQLLADARQSAPVATAEAAERAKWQADYDRRRADAARDGASPPVEFPPNSPYGAWAQRILDDWKAMLANFKANVGLSAEQQRQADAVLTVSSQQLADYLAGETTAIAEYQHGLWWLESLRSAPEADGAQFTARRIAGKEADTTREALTWVDQIKQFDRAYVKELRGLLTKEQLADEATIAALNMPEENRLRTINMAVAALTVGVGICLVVGLFTRLAAMAGALFLLAVIAAQPPWVSAAATTYYQGVELAGLLVLAGTGAGRWAGLDYSGYAFCNRFCRAKKQPG
jgi:uncharacterized membrane protein YphA (DoxX/SURF4 family)